MKFDKVLKEEGIASSDVQGLQIGFKNQEIVRRFPLKKKKQKNPLISRVKI